MRFVAWIVVGLVTNAVALLIASTFVDGFDIETLAFPIVVIVFSLIGAIVQPVVESVIRKSVHLLSMAVGLVAAFVTLLITDLVSSSIDITGVSAWVFGPLIIWGAGILTGLIVGRWLFRKIVGPRAA